MDLSQQELPLTAYFTRGNKEAKSLVAPHKKDRSTEDSQLVARAPKRRKSNVQSSTASPSSSSASQSKSRTTTLQLPTPAASTRKRTRNGRLELAKTPLMSTSSAERNAIPSIEVDTAQLESRSTPLKLPQSSLEGTEYAIPELSSIPFVTPSTSRRRTTKSIDAESHHNPRHSNHGVTGIPTPRTSSRRTSEPLCGVASSNCHTPSDARQTSAILSDAEVSHSEFPFSQQHSVHSTARLARFPGPLGSTDPFCTRETDGIFVQRDSAFAPSKQYSTSSKTSDVQTSGGHAIPTIPVPSSQSQYLLHLDATPKRKRCSQRIERVISSQTQEERELTLSTPHRPIAVPSLSRVSPVTCGNTQIPPLACGERKSQHLYTLGRNSLGSFIKSPPGLSSAFFATKEAWDEFSSNSWSPSRREKLTPNHSPSCQAKTPWRSPRHGLVENVPPHIEESLTEPESESDILQPKMKCRLSALNLPSRGVDQVPCHSLPVRCGSAEDNLPGVEDDSATEAESDTDILHCVAEISRQRPRDHHRSEAPREDTPLPLVISPLVSPTRPRNAATGPTQFLTQEGAGCIPGSCPPYSATMERPQMPSESLPAVVREFICMFPGDESYPADFPESLRV